MKSLLYFGFIFLFLSCAPKEKPLAPKGSPKDTIRQQLQQDHGYDQKMKDGGLVDVFTMDSSLIIDIKYSTPDNFLGFDVYGSFDKCYLQPDVAVKLVNANRFLKEEDSTLTLLIYDGARPRSIQKKMWDTIKTMPVQQGMYVSNPAKGSLHNFGAAVDLTIADQNGKPLDMGTSYDFFGNLAHTDKEQHFLKTGELSQKQFLNRSLLRKVMYKAGFFGIQSEWWHFNSCTRDQASQKYKIIE